MRLCGVQMRTLACSGGGELGSNGGPASPGVATGTGVSGGGAPVAAKGCVAVLQDALSTLEGLSGVQQHMQRLERSHDEAVQRVEAVEVLCQTCVSLCLVHPHHLSGSVCALRRDCCGMIGLNMGVPILIADAVVM